MFLKIIVVVVLLVVLIVGIVVVQDWLFNLIFGFVLLSGGFMLDLYIVFIMAGGNIDVMQVFDCCCGMIVNVLDFCLQFDLGLLLLIIGVCLNIDMIIVINGLDGQWYCDDDSGEGFNLSVIFNNLQGGQYDIWIGIYGFGFDFVSFMLMIFELGC